MKNQLSKLLLLILLGDILTSASFAQSLDPSRLIHRVISSNITNQDYRLFIVLPEDYSASSEESYDVVYALDIDTAASTQLVQFQRAFAQLPTIPAFILVGVGFSPDEEHRGLRTAHFSPSNNEEIDEEILALFPTLSTSANVENWRSGKAQEFAEVLGSEIIPTIEADFSTSGRDTAMGASLAGLFLTEVLIEQPELFENYVITSPSVWWNDFEIFQNNSSLNRDDLSGRVYLSVGGLENSEMLDSYNRLSDVLAENDSANLLFKAELIADQTHQSVIPISFMNGLNHIYSDPVD